MLKTITLTGVDDFTSLPALEQISELHPYVEWGFLYSPKQQGLPGRYPSVATLQQAFIKLPHHMKVALHVCGSGVPNLLQGEPVVTQLVELISYRGGRVQLNFNASRIESKFTLDEVRLCLERYPSVHFITQYNDANTPVHQALSGCANHAVLFDASGGQGKSPEGWAKPLDGVHCGYAGGLGPDNLAAELLKIQSAADTRPYWVDMEGKLRDQDDRFDLERISRMLGDLSLGKQVAPKCPVCSKDMRYRDSGYSNDFGGYVDLYHCKEVSPGNGKCSSQKRVPIIFAAGLR